MELVQYVGDDMCVCISYEDEDEEENKREVEMVFEERVVWTLDKEDLEKEDIVDNVKVFCSEGDEVVLELMGYMTDRMDEGEVLLVVSIEDIEE